MRDTKHFKKHLSIHTDVDYQTISEIEVEDPFHTTHVYLKPSAWELLKVLLHLKPHWDIRVKVRADGVAIGRWFQGADICENCKRARIDGHETKPGYEHGDERWCQACYHGCEEVPSVSKQCDQSK